MQKYEGGYREIAFVQMRLKLAPRRSLYTAMEITVLTDGEPFGLRIDFKPEELIKNYIKGLP